MLLSIDEDSTPISKALSMFAAVVEVDLTVYYFSI